MSDPQKPDESQSPPILNPSTVQQPSVSPGTHSQGEETVCLPNSPPAVDLLKLVPEENTTVDHVPGSLNSLPGMAYSAKTLIKPRLVVTRGLKVDAIYPLFPGKNYIGRTDDKPVDIDLDNQEAPDRIWCSRQHAIIHFENNQLAIEDLSSLNGTFVNRTRVHPGEKRELRAEDVIQIGTVHMRVDFDS